MSELDSVPADQKCPECGSAWLAGCWSPGCPTCDGGALSRPCPLCGGQCGEAWLRAPNPMENQPPENPQSEEGPGARWLGTCRLMDRSLA